MYYNNKKYILLKFMCFKVLKYILCANVVYVFSGFVLFFGDLNKLNSKTASNMGQINIYVVLKYNK